MSESTLFYVFLFVTEMLTSGYECLSPQSYSFRELCVNEMSESTLFYVFLFVTEMLTSGYECPQADT
jgi:hypothetical protein